MAGIPLLKLGGLLFRSLAKPLAKRMKDAAATHPSFRRTCIGLGRFFNSATNTMNSFLLYGRLKQIKPISDAEAVGIGAEVIGEGVLVSAAAAVVIIEWSRQLRDKANADAANRVKQQQKDKLVGIRFEDLEERVLQLEKELAHYRGVSIQNQLLNDVLREEKPNK